MQTTKEVIATVENHLEDLFILRPSPCFHRGTPMAADPLTQDLRLDEGAHNYFTNTTDQPGPLPLNLTLAANTYDGQGKPPLSLNTVTCLPPHPQPPTATPHINSSHGTISRRQMSKRTRISANPFFAVSQLGLDSMASTPFTKGHHC